MKKILSVLLCCVACVGAQAEKEGEDNTPVDGKADSFRNPTSHGVLPFESSSFTRLSADEKFHAWNFSLSGPADIDIKVTGSERSLDTVMYLYRRTEASASWGRYIARNDDDGDNVQSRIDGSYDEAEYRIIVKGFKDITYGSFSVKISCDGAGCVPTDDGQVTTPVETNFSEECEERLFESGLGEVVESSRLSVPVNPPSSFETPLRLAALHYQELTETPDIDDDGDPNGFDAYVEKRTNGTHIVLEDGGDESITDYFFDVDGNILAYYVNNQSPWTGYFCAEANESDIGAPDDECLVSWILHSESGEPTNTEEVYTIGGDNAQLSDLARFTMDHHVARDEDDLYLDGDELSFQLATAESGRSAEVFIVGEGVVLYSIDNGGDFYVVFESDENSDDGVSMLCLSGS